MSKDTGEARILVVIPTYNEVDNIATVTSGPRSAVPDAHVPIADGNGPDSTGKIADEMAEGDDPIRLLHRPGGRGLGAAYLAGFRRGMERIAAVRLLLPGDR